jgi:hypothetical protein
MSVAIVRETKLCMGQTLASGCEYCTHLVAPCIIITRRRWGRVRQSRTGEGERERDKRGRSHLTIVDMIVTLSL